MAFMAQPGILTIMKKLDFVQSRPHGWRLERNRLINADDEFTVMVQDDDIEGRDTFCEINSMEELNATRDMIMRRPIFTIARCRKPYDDSSGNEDTGYSYLDDKYVVLVNTANPEVRSQFDRAFQLAENFVKNGNNFRVTVSLSESIKQYYIANVHAHKENNRLATCTGCDIHLTHGVKAPNCCDKYIVPTLALWVICFPICLFTGFPYLCHKKCVINLKEEQIKQALPVTLQKGPFQPGYNLVSLLYAPPINYQQ